jgi:surface antigen
MAVKRLRRVSLICAIIVAIVAGLLWYNGRNAGVVVDSYKGVAIYDNGPLAFKSHGRHYSPSGYYWGQKWQCVEFIKRFYDQAKGHQMPDVWGHAKEFFDSTTPQGGLNAKRGLRQYQNGGDVAPRVDDLFVFTGGYGHVGIVSEVTSNSVEIVQQNIYKKPRQRFELIATNGAFRVQSTTLMGWLRRE